MSGEGRRTSLPLLSRSLSREGPNPQHHHHHHHNHPGYHLARRIQRYLNMATLFNLTVLLLILYFLLTYKSSMSQSQGLDKRHLVPVEEMPWDYNPRLRLLEESRRILLSAKSETAGASMLTPPQTPSPTLVPAPAQPPADPVDVDDLDAGMAQQGLGQELGDDPIGWGQETPGPGQPGDKPEKHEMKIDGIINVVNETRNVELVTKMGISTRGNQTLSCEDIRERAKRGRDKVCGEKGQFAGHRKRTSKSNKHMFVDEERKLVYCAVPRAGSSIIKNFFITTSRRYKELHKVNPQGLEQRENVTGLELLQKYGLTPLSSYNADKQDLILSTYYKLMIVRNPMEKLVATYRDKFLYHKTLKGFPHLAQELLHRYRPAHKNTLDLLSPKTYLKFTEMIDFVLYQFNASKTSRFEDDWDTVQNLCEPCVVEYDFVGQMEELDSSHHCILPKIHPDLSHLLSGNRMLRPPAARERFKLWSLSLYRLLATADKWSLYNQIYKNDCEMFGYDCVKYLVHHSMNMDSQS